tara:strand:+ start:122 stop:4288 length:4167 start_codon:yes stop_codon:yes gene_type:complete
MVMGAIGGFRRFVEDPGVLLQGLVTPEQVERILPPIPRPVSDVLGRVRDVGETLPGPQQLSRLLPASREDTSEFISAQTSPAGIALNLATAGLGPAAGPALRAAAASAPRVLSPGLRLAGRAVEPITQTASGFTGFVQRAAQEQAIEASSLLASQAAARETENLDIPGPLKTAINIGAGFAGGVAGLSTAPGVSQGVGKTLDAITLRRTGKQAVEDVAKRAEDLPGGIAGIAKQEEEQLGIPKFPKNSNDVQVNKEKINRIYDLPPEEKQKLPRSVKREIVREQNSPNPGNFVPSKNTPAEVIERIDIADKEYGRALDSLLPGETVEQRIILNYDGALRRQELEVKKAFTEANKILKNLNWGTQKKDTIIPRAGQAGEADRKVMISIRKLLFGEAQFADGSAVPLIKKEGRNYVSPENVRRYLSEQDIDASQFKNNNIENFQEVYEEAWRQTHFEENKRFLFDKDMNRVENYFNRGFKPRDNTNLFDDKGNLTKETMERLIQVGRKPGFEKNRVELTFDEMLDLGFEPSRWNVFDQVRITNMQGVKYRAEITLLDVLKKHLGKVQQIQSEGVIPAGYRVPNLVGFVGKKIYNPDGRDGQAFTYAVPNEIADKLELLFGADYKFGRIPTSLLNLDQIDLDKWVDKATFIPKQAKLFGSLFQDIDFGQRGTIGNFSYGVDQFIRAVNPVTKAYKEKPKQLIRSAEALLRIPVIAAEILAGRLSGGRKSTLKEMALDDTTNLVDRKILYGDSDFTFGPDGKKRNITTKMIMDNGLNIEERLIFGGKDLDKLATDVATETGALRRKPKEALEILQNVERWNRDGLFNGTYPAAILHDVKHNILPQVLQNQRGYTDNQIAASVASAANLKYSTIPISQSRITSKFIRRFLTALFFSIGENEGILRTQTRGLKSLLTLGGQEQVTKALNLIPGFKKISDENARYYGNNIVGSWLFLAMTASIIHKATTGENLPPSRLSPVSANNWSPLGIGYNSEFAAPTIPVLGEGEYEATIDLVGQMDTTLRALDPVKMAEGRFNVLPRAALNQVRSSNFHGDPIESLQGRGYQGLTDLFSPIGPGDVLEDKVFRNVPYLQDYIPGRAEVGLSTEGQTVEALGFNVRQNVRTEKRNAAARNVHGVDSWEDLSVIQKYQASQDPRYKDTLFDEDVIRASKGNKFSQYKVERDRIETLTSDGIGNDSDDFLIDLHNDTLVHRDWEEKGQRNFRNVYNIFKNYINTAKDREREESIRLDQYRKDNGMDNYTGDESTNPDDIMLNEYYAIYDKPENREGPDLIWENVEKDQKEFRATLSPEQRSSLDYYINRKIRKPIYQELEQLWDYVNNLEGEERLFNEDLMKAIGQVYINNSDYTGEVMNKILSETRKTDFTYLGEVIEGTEE